MQKRIKKSSLSHRRTPMVNPHPPSGTQNLYPKYKDMSAA